MLVALDLLGIFVFAITGGLVAVRNQLDVFGVVVLAMATGLGGGVIRDVLIGAIPPPALADWRYLVTPVAAGLVTFLWHPVVSRLEGVVNVFDAVGVGMFCVAGALKAHDYGLGPAPAAALGMVTGVGGGVIRDLLGGRQPVLLRSRELYAIPALAGAAVASTAVELGLSGAVVVAPAALLATGWRLLAIRNDWTAPVPRISPPE